MIWIDLKKNQIKSHTWPNQSNKITCYCFPSKSNWIKSLAKSFPSKSIKSNHLIGKSWFESILIWIDSDLNCEWFCLSLNITIHRCMMKSNYANIYSKICESNCILNQPMNIWATCQGHTFYFPILCQSTSIRHIARRLSENLVIIQYGCNKL